ncbi:MAG TPA: hypothetical protein QF753_08830 [Victivallales bacterium]|nr:hypothetical protein [Victivallales bacterium]
MVKLKKKLPEDIENYFNIDINLLNLDYFLKNYEVSEKILLKIRKYLFGNWKRIDFRKYSDEFINDNFDREDWARIKKFKRPFMKKDEKMKYKNKFKN